MRFPSCTSLGLIILLLCCCFPIAARAHGNESVSRSPIAPVDSSAQLSTNQLFSGLWQIKGVPEINKLTVDLPGRVFISHVSSNSTTGSSSSESAAEIKVSGNSQEVVDAVTVDCSEEDLAVATSRKPLAGEYLLVEIQLRDRNSVHKVFSDGPGDVVIGEDVLASTDIVSKVSGTSGARRLQLNGNGAGVAEAVSPGQVTAATGTTGEASATTASGFTIEEAPSNANSATTKARMWMIKTTGGGKASSNVNLGLSVPGSAVIDRLRDYASSGSGGEIYAGRVVVFGDDVPGLDQVEVVSTLLADVESLQVRLKPNDSASPAATTKSFTTLIGLTAAFPIAVITPENTVQVKELQKDATHTNETLQVGNSGEGTVFVSAPKSLIVSSSVAFTAHKTGGIQVEIGKLWTTNAMSLTIMSSGVVSYFGETVSSQVWTTPSEIGNICVSADHDLNGVSVTNSYESRVFFTGSSATTPTSSCEKLSIPERVPAETLSSEPAAATSAPGVSSGGRSSSRSTCGVIRSPRWCRTSKRVRTKSSRGVGRVAVISELSGIESSAAEYVVVLADDAADVAQVAVLSTDAANIHVQLNPESNASGTATSSNFTTLIGLSHYFQAATETSSARSQVQKLDLNLVRFGVQNAGEGTIFVSAPKSFVALSSAYFGATSIGSIQVELGTFWAASVLHLITEISRLIHCFGGVAQATVWSQPSTTGRICMNARNFLPELRMTTSDNLEQLTSYRGKPTGRERPPACEKHPLLDRVPAETLSVSVSDQLGHRTAGTRVSAKSVFVWRGYVVLATLLFAAMLVVNAEPALPAIYVGPWASGAESVNYFGTTLLFDIRILSADTTSSGKICAASSHDLSDNNWVFGSAVVALTDNPTNGTTDGTTTTSPCMKLELPLQVPAEVLDGATAPVVGGESAEKTPSSASTPSLVRSPPVSAVLWCLAAMFVVY